MDNQQIELFRAWPFSTCSVLLLTHGGQSAELDQPTLRHMAAVENATDDGTLTAFLSDDETETTECDCDGLGGFPCWLCVRTGRKELPNEPSLQPFFIHGRPNDGLGSNRPANARYWPAYPS